MKKALVLGASGGMGYALVRELVSRNIMLSLLPEGKKNCNLYITMNPRYPYLLGMF